MTLIDRKRKSPKKVIVTEAYSKLNASKKTRELVCDMCPVDKDFPDCGNWKECYASAIELLTD